MAKGTPEEILLQELEREQPREAASLVAGSVLGSTDAGKTMTTLLREGQVVSLGTTPGKEAIISAVSSNYVLSNTAWKALLDEISSLLSEFHQRYPLRAGMPREELKSRLGLPARAFGDAIATAAAQGQLCTTETVISRAGYRVTFSPEQQRRVTELLQAFEQSPHAPPSLAESEALVGADVLAALVEQGSLIKVSDTVLFAADTYQRITKAIVAHLQKEGHITLAQVRDMFDTSRKYAQAILEHLDEKHVTKRVGDERILR